MLGLILQNSDGFDGLLDDLKTFELRNTFLMKNSELAVYINALRSLAREGYIEPISDNFFDDTLSLKYEFNLTLKGEFAAESLV